MDTKILVVDDEPNIVELNRMYLEGAGYQVVAARTGPEALDRFRSERPNLVVLDLMLPGLSGTEVCRELRQRGPTPVIMLTAKDSEIDKVVGLEIGADDYVTKPYSYRELVARMRAVLRRGVGTEDTSAPAVLELGRVAMDVDRHELRVDGELVAMPLREFELLEMFLRNPDRVLTRGQLIDRIWGPNYVGDTKTLDVHVKRVRAKIEVNPGHPELLQTVRGLGYKLVTPRGDE